MLSAFRLCLVVASLSIPLLALAQASCPVSSVSCAAPSTDPTGSCCDNDVGCASYDAIQGLLSVEVWGGEMVATMSDSYVVTDLPPGTPVALRAQLLLEQSGDDFPCEGGACDYPRAGVEAFLNGPASASTCPVEPGTSLLIDVPAQAGVPFGISCSLRGYYEGCTASGIASSHASGRLRFLDLPASARITSCQGFEQTAVGVGADPLPLAFALDAPRPNPTRGAFHAIVTLSTGAPAFLALYDVAGRLVARTALQGPGRRSVDMGGPDLKAGVYQLRLSQEGRIGSSRLIVVN